MEKNYDHKIIENKWKNYWNKNKIYAFDKNSDKEIFSVDTPPPYVSSDYIHMGHAMSYVQADMAIRYQRLKGKNVLYPMGFDDNGLPTERFIEKKYNVDKSKISRSDFVKLCLEETKIGGQNYAKAFADIALSCDFDLYEPFGYYTTISKYAQKISQISFKDLFDKGAIEQRQEPFLYCTVSQTAVANEDLEDIEKESFMNYIKFTFDDGTDAIIATTRPELIPACVAIFHHPDDKRFLDKRSVKVPLFNHEVKIYADESVDMEKGTGLMMVCTFGDKEDVFKWKKYNLDLKVVVNTNGTLNDLASKYAGMKILKAREEILKDLQESGFLIKQDKIVHTTNVYERTKNPVEFLLTTQWFIKTTNIKQDLLEYGKKVNWHPQSMYSIYADWVNNLQWDWCISRQRFFGVPIPIYYCSECNTPHVPNIEYLPIDPSINKCPIEKCNKCGNTNFTGETDVLDTWFTSSVSPQIVLGWGGEDKFDISKMPVSLRPQAFEIIRTWAFYTIVKSYYHHQDIPWQNTMISGHALDRKGQKMSKSLGNGVDPRDVIEKYGADVLRFWGSGCNLGSSLRFNEEELLTGKKLLNKIYNVAKFLYSFIDKYKSNIVNIDKIKSDILNNSIKGEFNNMLKNYCKYFDQYEYSLARQVLDQFFWNDFCDNYLEIVKYPLYQLENDIDYIYNVFDIYMNILILYSPFMPFITEEIYQDVFINNVGYNGKRSIHLEDIQEEYIDCMSVGVWDVVKNIISQVRKIKTEMGISIAKDVDMMDIILSDGEKELLIDNAEILDLIYKTVKVNKLNF